MRPVKTPSSCLTSHRNHKRNREQACHKRSNEGRASGKSSTNTSTKGLIDRAEMVLRDGKEKHGQNHNGDQAKLDQCLDHDHQ